MKKFRYLIIVFIIAIDQLVKALIRNCMYVGESVPVIKGVFNITYVQNRGAAFNLFSGANIMLIAIPLIALVAAVWYMEKHSHAHWSLFVSLQLIISGGIGNLIDRVLFGYVTDLFDFIVWPVFNIADIAVCVGCGFLILYMFVFDKSDKEEVQE